MTYRITYKALNSNNNQIENPNTKKNEHRGTITDREKIHVYELGYKTTPRKGEVERTDFQARYQEAANDEANDSELYNHYGEINDITDDLLSRKEKVQHTRFKKSFPSWYYRCISNNNNRSHFRVGSKPGRLP